MNQNLEVRKTENYIYLDKFPSIPSQITPTHDECFGYEFMTMVQFCKIAMSHGIGRSRACNAFGGDRGKYQVISDRMARVFNGRKFVLIRAVDMYFKQIGIEW